MGEKFAQGHYYQITLFVRLTVQGSAVYFQCSPKVTQFGKSYSVRIGVLRRIANVAQLVEQLIRNEQVSGSSPLIGSQKYN